MNTSFNRYGVKKYFYRVAINPSSAHQYKRKHTSGLWLVYMSSCGWKAIVSRTNPFITCNKGKKTDCRTALRGVIYSLLHMNKMNCCQTETLFFSLNRISKISGIQYDYSLLLATMSRYSNSDHLLYAFCALNVFVCVICNIYFWVCFKAASLFRIPILSRSDVTVTTRSHSKQWWPDTMWIHPDCPSIHYMSQCVSMTSAQRAALRILSLSPSPPCF